MERGHLGPTCVSIRPHTPFLTMHAKLLPGGSTWPNFSLVAWSQTGIPAQGFDKCREEDLSLESTYLLFISVAKHSSTLGKGGLCLAFREQRVEMPKTNMWNGKND